MYTTLGYLGALGYARISAGLTECGPHLLGNSQFHLISSHLDELEGLDFLVRGEQRAKTCTRNATLGHFRNILLHPISYILQNVSKILACRCRYRIVCTILRTMPHAQAHGNTHRTMVQCLIFIHQLSSQSIARVNQAISEACVQLGKWTHRVLISRVSTCRLIDEAPFIHCAFITD